MNADQPLPNRRLPQWCSLALIVLLRNRRMPKWCSLAWMVLLRTWLTFSIMAFAVAILSSAVHPEDLLKSDDPYVPALIAAGFCASFAFVYGVVRACGGSPLTQLIAYFGSALGLSILFVVVDAIVPMGEGRGILTFCGVLIAICGAASYPLLRIPLTKLSIVCSLDSRAPIRLGYYHAFIAMRTRSFYARATQRGKGALPGK